MLNPISNSSKWTSASPIVTGEESLQNHGIKTEHPKWELFDEQ